MSVIQLTSWTAAVNLYIPSSTRTLGITKFVQGGCQSSLQTSTDEHGWKHACNFCDDYVKERVSCNGLSQAMKYECTTMNKSKHGVETHTITQD